MAITFRSALFHSLNEIADAQTAAYGGDWRSSATKLAEICRVQSIDLEHSVAAFDGRTPVGMALVGRRGERGWIHDIGVAPAYQKRGMGRQMMRVVLDGMRQSNVREVELDVAAMRADAVTFYQRLGFRHHRTYLNLASTLQKIKGTGSHTRRGRAIVAGSETRLIVAYAEAQKRELPPCWDRSLPSLLAYQDGYISRLMEGERELGLMHYLARRASGGDPDRLRPLFVRLHDASGPEVLAELLVGTAEAAFGESASLTLRVALEPQGTTLAQFLQALKIPVVAESYDMRMAL